jgi:hypothetical protein
MNTASFNYVSFRRLLWLALFSFLVLTCLFEAWMGRLCYLQAHRELWPPDSLGGPLWCGNSLTDPLGIMLNLVAPCGVAASIALLVMAWRGKCNWAPALTAGTLTTFGVVSLVAFGMWAFRTYLGDSHLSDQVWWMIRL